MPRAREGSVEFRNGCWQAHLWMPGPKPRKRQWFRLDPQPKDRAQAKDAARIAQEMLDTCGYVPSVRDITVTEWTEKRWLKMQEKRWPDSWTNDRSNLRMYIQPEIGTLPMRGVTREHLRGLVAKLDTMIDDGKIASSTAHNIWRTCTGMFGDAVSSKVEGIVVLEVNPALNIEPPKEGIQKEKQFLYPDEFLTLVSCQDVPLIYARVYAFAIYTGMRQAEILGCEWRDIDLAHGRIHVHHTADFMRGDGTVNKPTKAHRSRRIPIEENLRPLLEAMKKEAGDNIRVFSDPPTVTGEYGLANMIRRHVAGAGADKDRPELTRPAAETQRALTFHDTRATHTVWRLKRNHPGDAPIDVKDDGGWGSLAMVDVYSRLARHMGGAPFPTLPKRLLTPESAEKSNSPGKAPRGYSSPTNNGKSVGAAGLEPATSSV